MDTEGASFHRFVDRIYLLQLSTRERTAIIDPLAVVRLEGLGTAAGPIPRSRSYSATPITACDCLRQDYGWQVRGLFDTRVAAPTSYSAFTPFGLAALLERYFGVEARQEVPARRSVHATALRGDA